MSIAEDTVRTWRDQVEPASDHPAPDANANQLRRRMPRKLKGYCIDSDAGANGYSSDESLYPPTPQDDYFPPMPTHPAKGMAAPESEYPDPEMLPEVSETATDVQLTLFESLLDVFAPYHEMREARLQCDHDRYDKVLARLLTEWYVVGASVSYPPLLSVSS